MPSDGKGPVDVDSGGVGSARQRGDQIDVLLHGLLGREAVKLAPGVELGRGNEIEPARPFPCCIAFGRLLEKGIKLQHGFVIWALAKAVHLLLSLNESVLQ